MSVGTYYQHPLEDQRVFGTCHRQNHPESNKDKKHRGESSVNIITCTNPVKRGKGGGAVGTTRWPRNEMRENINLSHPPPKPGPSTPATTDGWARLTTVTRNRDRQAGTGVQQQRQTTQRDSRIKEVRGRGEAPSMRPRRSHRSTGNAQPPREEGDVLL
ncbi:hypothetical protein LZ30DRAFT_741029 [Colletotrichum cereale]|nr:hypothetical protein LZ30DRAFT_741029 [Colletotrichum cereale]